MERDHYVAGQPPKFSRCAQEFKHLDGRSSDWRNARPGLVPPRVTTPDYPAASLDAWRSSPAVRKERRRGIFIGFVLGMVVYGFGSLVLVLAFHALAVHP